MQRNFVVSIVQTATLALIAVLLLFRAFQTNHAEKQLIATKQQVEELTTSLNDLRRVVERGGGRQRGPADSAATAPFESQYWSADEWAAMNRPGNYLVPREERWHGDDVPDGGTIKRAAFSDLPGLNPVTQNAADVSELYHYIAESLATRERSNPERWIPVLAHRIEVNEDHTEYHVFLKQGVLWHPPAVDLTDPRYEWLRGERELVADDFVFYLELVQNPQVDAAFLRNYYEQCEGIEVINDHEFIIRWSEPVFHSISFSLGLAPLPRWLYGHDEEGVPFDASEVGRQFNSHWYNLKAIGTGPYRFVSWEQGGAVVLERWARYHGEEPPIGRIEYRVVADATARLNGLRAGQLDYISLLQTQFKNEIQDGGTPGFRNGDLEHEQFQGATYRYLGWNMDGVYFSDRRVRQAMTFALNREMLLRENFFGLGRMVTGPFFIDGPDYNHDLVDYTFDLARAGELLTEAGWVDNDGDGIREKLVNGRVVKFEFGMLTYGHRPEFIAAMEHYRNDLARIGVVLNILPVEWAVMIQRMQEKDFDAYTGGWQLGWDADPYQIWHSSQADAPGGSNRIGFRNAEADRIIEQARRTFDPAERTALFMRFHEIVHEEQPYTFWFAPLEIGAWRSHVKNVGFSPLRPFDSNLNWYLSP